MWVTHKPDECNSKPDTSPVANESNVEATDEGGTQEEQIYEAALAQVELESDSE
jgi:hypothetical protein